jgi:hypothetical protein
LKNKFDLGSTTKTVFAMGEINVTKVQPLLPGSVLRGGTDVFCRVTPLLAPIYNKMEMVTETFFVADRQVWEDAEDFHSGGSFGSTPPVHPTIDLVARVGGVAEGDLANQMGIPVGSTAGTRTVNALPFRAFALIKNFFLTDDNYQTPIGLSMASGTDVTTNVTSQIVNWKKDYFMGLQPRQQKAESILLEIERIVNAPAWKAYKSGTETAGDINTPISTDGSGSANLYGVGGTNANLSLDPNGGLVLDAKEIRDGLMLTKYFENAERRGSNKYSDYIAQAFGCSRQDMRLDNPVRISRSKDILRFSEIIQTAPDSTSGDSEDTGVGSYKGHGIGSLKGRGYKFFVPEHGHLITIKYIRPSKACYPQGLNRHWSKTLKEHYFQPELAHMSSQAVLNKEIYAEHSNPNGTLGYGDMYDEYRQSMDVTSGSFLSTQDHWHLDRLFSGDFALNSATRKCIPSDRIFQDQSSGDHFFSLDFHKLMGLLPIPKSGQPTSL